MSNPGDAPAQMRIRSTTDAGTLGSGSGSLRPGHRAGEPTDEAAPDRERRELRLSGGEDREGRDQHCTDAGEYQDVDTKLYSLYCSHG